MRVCASKVPEMVLGWVDSVGEVEVVGLKVWRFG